MLIETLITDDEKAGRVPKKESWTSDPGVQLLPRQDVMLCGTIPKVEQRLYSKCKECGRVFNPRDILSHRNCSKSSHFKHPSLLKKKLKSKSGTNKKTSTSSSISASYTSNRNSTVGTTSSSPVVKEPVKDFDFKKPYPLSPLKTASPSLPELKVSVTKIGLPKVSKTATTVLATSTASTSTTSSDKSDSRVSSSKVSTSVHHSPSRSPSSMHHSSKSSSVHSPRSPSSSVHHSPKSPSSIHRSQKTPSSSVHHSPRSPSSSTHSPRSPSSSVHHSPKSPSKSSSSSHHGTHHSSSSSHHSSKSSTSSKPTPMDTLPPTSASSHHHHSSSSTSHSSSNRHKKSSSGSSKRSSSSSNSGSSGSSSSTSSSKILPKDYDPDTHCGVIDGSRGPCMRSITCSNHRIQLRKLVPGRSKDIHQLIAERKAAKEEDLKHTTPPCSYTSPNGEAKDILSQNTIFVPDVGKTVNTNIESSTVSSSFVPIMPRVSNPPRQSSTSILRKMINVSETETDSPNTLTNGYLSHAKNIKNSQEDVVGTVPVLVMLMSPVPVVNSVQFVKIGHNIISLESPQSAMSPPLKNSSVTLPIQANNCNNIKMYKSHPKPIVLPSFNTRRLGGAILLANPRLESQRNELLTALNSKRETVNNNRGISLLNHSNNPHRPNILKVKSGTKNNCKRPASDKLVTSDSKRLVPDVNGFILHADVSETAEAPQSNNCIQEKIALLNMK